MDPNLARYIRRNLSRIGWGVLFFFLAAQVIGGCVQFIPGVAGNIYLSNLASYAVIYGFAPLVLWLVLRPLPKGACPGLSLSPRAFARSAVFSVGILYLFNLVTSLLILAVESLTGAATGDLLQAALESMPKWFYLLLVGLLAPVFEELIFRRLLLDRLRPYGDRCAIWFSALAFGLFHMNLYQFFYATAAGLIFAGIVLKTGKIWHTILLHAIVNLSSAALTFLSGTGEWAVALSGVLILICIGLAIYCFVRYFRSFRHFPPQLPATGGEVLRCLLRAPGVWVCALLSLAVSAAVIFLV